MFCSVNLGNLENFSQRNLRSDKTRECIFRASGGQTWWRLRVFNVCAGLPKKTLDMSLLNHAVKSLPQNVSLFA